MVEGIEHRLDHPDFVIIKLDLVLFTFLTSSHQSQRLVSALRLKEKCSKNCWGKSAAHVEWTRNSPQKILWVYAQHDLWTSHVESFKWIVKSQMLLLGLWLQTWSFSNLKEVFVGCNEWGRSLQTVFWVIRYTNKTTCQHTPLTLWWLSEGGTG
jgi:hypothetical protein